MLAKKDKNAVLASLQVNYQPNKSKASFTSSEV